MRCSEKQLITTLIVAEAIFTAATMSARASDPVPPPPTTPSLRTSDHGGFGLGVIVGEPTGLTAKYWLSHPTAIDATAAWSFEDPGYFQINSDFLYHNFDLLPVDKGELPLYFGVGGRVEIPEHGDTRVGVRIPVGIAYEFHDLPLEVFGEIAPIVDFVPDTRARLSGGIGIRYYFR